MSLNVIFKKLKKPNQNKKQQQAKKQRIAASPEQGTCSTFPQNVPSWKWEAIGE